MIASFVARSVRGGVAFPLAFAAGAAAVLALPPFSMLPVALLAFAALFLLVSKGGARRSFVLGWAFGLGHFAFGLSWIAESFAVDAERYGWMAVPAVAGLSAVLALFPALACTVFARLRIGGVTGAVAFAACWTAAEWLRGHVLTGFPWNLAGYALAEFDALRQPAAWIGSYGLSFLVVLVATLPAVALQTTGARRAGPLVLGGLLFFVLLGAGWSRLATAPFEGTGVRLRIVQGNVAQTDKWRPGLREAIFARYLSLSAAPGAFDVLLWPEAAFPGDLDEDVAAVARIERVLDAPQILMTGTPDRVTGGEGTRYFNAVQAYDAEGEPIAAYAKHHLVPFGEYVPEWLPMGRLVETPGDFTAGPGPRTLSLPGLPLVGVAICYEIVFPGSVVDGASRPRMDLQRHQRRLVRYVDRPPPAPRHGPDARGRGGAAGRAGRKYWHLGGDRHRRPRPRPPRNGPDRGPRRRAADRPAADSLRADRRPRLAAAPAGHAVARMGFGSRRGPAGEAPDPVGPRLPARSQAKMSIGVPLRTMA